MAHEGLTGDHNATRSPARTPVLTITQSHRGCAIDHLAVGTPRCARFAALKCNPVAHMLCDALQLVPMRASSIRSPASAFSDIAPTRRYVESASGCERSVR